MKLRCCLSTVKAQKNKSFEFLVFIIQKIEKLTQETDIFCLLHGNESLNKKSFFTFVYFSARMHMGLKSRELGKKNVFPKIMGCDDLKNFNGGPHFWV